MQMATRLSILALLTVTLGLLTACETRKAMNLGAEPVAILNQHQGSEAALAGPDVFVVNSQEQLQALGCEDLIDKGIDFSRRSLVIVALGERPTGGHTVLINGVQLQNSDLYVQGVATEPSPDATVTQALTHPYAAAEVDKIDATGLTIHPEIDTVSDGR
jgi:hypothetical protein